MFVFGEVQDPLPETVRLVEDVVRGQVIEIVSQIAPRQPHRSNAITKVTRARLLSHIRNSRFLSAEDLIFLIRDDRGKVNRLRTYLSWKDVRKRAKDDNGADAGDVVEDLGEVGNGSLPSNKPRCRRLTSVHRQSGNEDEETDHQAPMGASDLVHRLFAPVAFSRPVGR
jgi:hypothetical protein